MPQGELIAWYRERIHDAEIEAKSGLRKYCSIMLDTLNEGLLEEELETATKRRLECAASCSKRIAAVGGEK